MTEIIRPSDPNWTLPSETSVVFIAAAALSRDTFTIAASVDGGGHDEFGNFSRLYRYERGDWICAEIDQRIDSIIPYQPSDWARAGYALLSQTAQVTFLGPASRDENILATAGDEVPVYGPTTRIRCLGKSLFVCGLGGQIYRREADSWTDFSHFRHNISRPPDQRDGSFPARRALSLESVAFNIGDIASFDLSDYYACGTTDYFKGILLYKTNFGDWERLLNGELSDSLYTILVEGPNDVWISGSGSLLMHGSKEAGFRRISSEVPGIELESMARYQGHLYVGGGNGLLRLDGDRLVACRTSRPVSVNPNIGRPNVDDTHYLQAIDGVLWNFGYQGIQRLDGEVWEEIPFPAMVLPD